MESYFDVGSNPRCPVTSCDLLSLDTTTNTCGSAISKTNENWFSADSTPFAISTYSNQIKSKTSDVCYQCSNKHRTLTVPITGLVQESKCKQTLNILQTGDSEPVDTPAPSWGKLYKNTEEKELIASGTVVMNFTSSDETNCPVTQCELKSSDCSGAYTSVDNHEGTPLDTDLITMDSVTPFNVYAKVN